MLQRRGSPGNVAESPHGPERKGGQLSGEKGANCRERAIDVGRTGGKISWRPQSEKSAQ